MNWERGIVTLVSSNHTFVASSYDQVAMFADKIYNLGDCIEFRTNEKREIIESRRCDRFVDFDRKFSGVSIVLICDVVDVQMKFVKFWNKSVRCFRTNFIEVVYDQPNYPKTNLYSLDQLIGSRIVIARVPLADKSYSFWKVTAVSEVLGVEQARPNCGVLDFIKPIENTNRTQYTGWICTYGSRKNGNDELFAWIPFEKHSDIMIPARLRKNIARDQFYGRWVTLSMEHSIFPDDDSDVKLIDDVFPTRKHAGRWEIKIPCQFDERTRKSGNQNNTVHSVICGNIIDIENTLDKYNRLESFSENLWVAYNYEDKRRINRFILSDRQDDWERKPNYSEPRSRSPRRYYDEEEEEEAYYDRNQNNHRDYSSSRSDSEEVRYSDDSDYEEQGNGNSSSSRLNRDRSPSPTIPTTENVVTPEYILRIKDDLKRLEKKCQYLLENDLEIPEKLKRELENTRFEVLKHSKNEVNEDELQKYRNLVVLIRKMLTSQKVCEKMRNFDSQKMDEISRLIFKV